MQTYDLDVLIIGAGPAGLGAGIKAREMGAGRVLVLERDFEAGGILNQCIHNGFGLQYFSEELTGPEYAGRFIREAGRAGVEVQTDTMVLEVKPSLEVITSSKKYGLQRFRAKSVVLAMGCRERTRDAIQIYGTRPAGILTAGTAQRYTNIEGFLPGRQVVVLGSGDIGLIMARRMKLEGCQVQGVYELLPYTNGLSRNVVQCLNDFSIPLYLQQTIARVHGDHRLEGVTAVKVDKKGKTLPGTEEFVPCDTLLLSVGLIPENELSRKAGVEIDPRTGGPIVNQGRMTNIPGIFACGNVVQVHDLADDVTVESEIAGISAALFERGKETEQKEKIDAGKGLGYVVPQEINLDKQRGEPLLLFMRAELPRQKVKITINQEGKEKLVFPLPFIKPGEIIKITIEPDDLRELIPGKDIQVTVRGEGKNG